MDMQSYIDEIKLKVTGGVLELEIDDSTLQKIVESAFREIQRYIDSTRFATLPYSQCIDLTDCKVSSVVRVYRAYSYMGDKEPGMQSSMGDPMYAAQWQLLAGNGTLMNFTDYVYNYASWNTLLQLRNTTSTDMAFRYDKSTNRLYINTCYNNPEYITIEFVPRYDYVDEIVSDYWIDKLMRLSIALTKVTLGRIRTRYVQNDAPWQQDGQSLLEEGNAELTELREKLDENSQLCYPVD